jgi:hypothetical protein
LVVREKRGRGRAVMGSREEALEMVRNQVGAVSFTAKEEDLETAPT